MSFRFSQRSRTVLAVAAVGVPLGVGAPALAADLSDKSVTVLMNYAWTILPNKFTTPAGKIITVDKSKKDDVMVPLPVARDVIKVARLSAHAQICKLIDKQVANYRTMMKSEEDKKTWSEQQMLFINQLHLFTVMWLTGGVKIEERNGENVITIDESEGEKEQTCTDEQKQKVEAEIDTYVKGTKTTQ